MSTQLSRLKLHFTSEEKNSVLKVLENGVLSRAGRGPQVLGFQKEFARAHRVSFAVATNSGTAALHTAIVALSLPRGSQVLLPSLTFVSTASVVLQEGLEPIFTDVDPQTFLISSREVQKKITHKTKAIIVVHLYGNVCDMSGILRLARSHRLRVIEDCAQAHGATYRQTRVGTIGDIGCFSFYQTKIMTTGEGGMAITRNKKLWTVMKSVADHGLIGERLEDYDYNRLGYNYHPTEMQAALGRMQLRKLRAVQIARKRAARTWQYLLKDSGLTFQTMTPQSFTSPCYIN